MNKELIVSIDDPRVIWVDVDQLGKKFRLPAVRVDGADWIMKNPWMNHRWFKLEGMTPEAVGYQFVAALDRNDLLRSGALGDVHSILEDGAL